MEAGQRPQRGQCSIEHIWGALARWEAGCQRQDAGGRRLEEGGRRPEAGGQSQRLEAGGQKGMMFHRQDAGGRMSEAGCRRLEEGGQGLEARGWRPEPEARGWRPEAGQGGVVGWMYGRTYGCNQETIRCDLHRMYHSTIAVHEKSQKFVFLKGQKSAFFFVPEAI